MIASGVLVRFQHENIQKIPEISMKIFTARNEVGARLCFYKHVSVILFMEGVLISV